MDTESSISIDYILFDNVAMVVPFDTELPLINNKFHEREPLIYGLL